VKATDGLVTSDMLRERAGKLTAWARQREHAPARACDEAAEDLLRAATRLDELESAALEVCRQRDIARARLERLNIQLAAWSAYCLVRQSLHGYKQLYEQIRAALAVKS
jgi:hypothetical protein